MHQSVSTYKSWENGRGEPRSLTSAARVCEILGISLDYYVTGRESQTVERLKSLPVAIRDAIYTLINNYK